MSRTGKRMDQTAAHGFRCVPYDHQLDDSIAVLVQKFIESSGLDVVGPRLNPLGDHKSIQQRPISRFGLQIQPLG